ALCQGSTIGLGDLPPSLAGATASPAPALLSLPEKGCDLEAVIAEAERRLILQALERTGGVRTQAAKLLGVTFPSLRYRLAKLGIAGDEEPGARGVPEEGEDEEGAGSTSRIPSPPDGSR